jgi:hypothetical protein
VLQEGYLFIGAAVQEDSSDLAQDSYRRGELFNHHSHIPQCFDLGDAGCRLTRSHGVDRQVEEMITKAAKKGQMPSQIGVLLRDQHGIPLVKSVTGSKILRILKAHGEKLVTLLFDSCVWRPKCGVLILSDVRL